MSDFYIIVFFTSAVQVRLFEIHIGEYAPLVKEGNRKNKHLLSRNIQGASATPLLKTLFGVL